MFDTGLADRIRAKAAAWGMPLDVVEVDGWRTRGRQWTRLPDLSLGHHTANRNMGWAPSLGMCINGRGQPGDADYVPGPLCQALRARKRDDRYTVFVIAAGVANHAGKGGYEGHVGNSSCGGLEVENVGTSEEPWTDLDQEIDALILAAMIEGAGGGTSCEHKEWTTRKVDRHTINGDTTRRLVAKYLGPPPVPEPEPHPPTTEEPDMDFFIIRHTTVADRWLFFPEMGDGGRKALLPDGPAAAEAAANKRYQGELKLEKVAVDGIPNLGA